MRTQSFVLTLLVLASAPTMTYAWNGDPWGPISRETIISIASEMVDVTWTPLVDITNYDGPTGRNYYSGTMYTGEAYTNSKRQDLAEFLTSVGSTPGGATFYGNNCTGSVNISWRLPSFNSLPDINSRLGGGHYYALGDLGDAPFLSLLPGDAFFHSGHIFLLSKFNPDGTIEALEQIAPAATRRIWPWSAFAPFRPIRRNLLDGGLTVNDRVQTSYDVPVRACPSIACGTVATATMAAQGTIVEGPQTGDEYQWWKIQYDDLGIAGWTTEGYLRKLVDLNLPCTGSGGAPPVGTLVINSGGPYTNARTVALNLSCTGSTCATMRFSRDGSTWTAWEPFANLRPWILSSGDGSKTIYAQLADACGTSSVTFSATVALQTATPDLVVSSLTVPAGNAGETIDVTDTVANIGSGGANASVMTFFLSSDNSLDSGDILLGTATVPTLAAGTSSTGTTAIAIPLSVSPGTYYVFAKANSVAARNDCSWMTPCGSMIETTRNNNSKLAKITIGSVASPPPPPPPPPPAELDMLPGSPYMPPAPGEMASVASLSGFMTGNTVTLAAVSKNSGGDVAGPSTTRLDSGDTSLNSGPVLKAGALAKGTATATVTASASSSTSYAVARSDASSSVQSPAIATRPDLVISSLVLSGTATTGATIDITDTSHNAGAAAADTSTTVFLLWSSNSGDILLGQRTVPALVAGATSIGTVSVAIPAGILPGTYYLVARANGSNTVVESDYENNTVYTAIVVD